MPKFEFYCRELQVCCDKQTEFHFSVIGVNYAVIFAACQCCSDDVFPLSIVARETCCQPSCLLLSLHCLPLSFPLLHCSWPQGTVGFLNALPPLWAHIDWRSAPPKAEQHGVPAASFLLVLLRNSLGEKNKGRKSSGGFSTTCLSMSLLFSFCQLLLL